MTYKLSYCVSMLATVAFWDCFENDLQNVGDLRTLG